MRRAFLAALLLAPSACSEEPPPKPRPGAKPPTVILIANGVVLATGRGAPTVIGIDPAGPSVSIIVKHDVRTHIDAYLLPSAASALPRKECETTAGARPDLSCVRDLPNGVKETLERSAGARAVALVLREGPGRVDVRLDYDERSRAMSLRLPQLAPPSGAGVCKDNGCNPIVEMMPLRAGTLRAGATFNGGPARLQVLQGRVIAKAFTGTGIPYRIAAERIGSSPLNLTARLDAPGEYALAFMNEHPSNGITSIAVEARWP
ncbi:MAG: hypothetical protein ACRDJM_06175 [Actinomycetota bacterium]